VENLEVYPTPALLSNIRLGCKDVPGTNAPAYLAFLSEIKRKKVVQRRHPGRRNVKTVAICSEIEKCEKRFEKVDFIWKKVRTIFLEINCRKIL
jgi:hypothetical protein